MKANTIRLYKHFCEMAENPKGVDLQEKNLVKAQAIKNKTDLEHRFKTALKYRSDPEIQTLLSSTKPKEEKKEEPKKEVKENGKKSKR